MLLFVEELLVPHLPGSASSPLTWFVAWPRNNSACYGDIWLTTKLTPDLSHRITSFLQHSFSALASGRHVGRESAQLCASCGFGEVESADTEQLIVYAIDNKRVLHSASACAMQKDNKRMVSGGECSHSTARVSINQCMGTLTLASIETAP